MAMSLFSMLSTGFANGQIIKEDDSSGDKIICHCTMFGSCKASGSGSNCAQSEAGGNIQCSNYDGNC
ncbi:hypothetical protein [Marivirga sp.]|uniref:hypothetical protein n=1 Tax=Marivirga sp. TaxID=2018662 RepID=UPI002D7E246E|nr:hypothetical protein [Marivirga sp.]HET8860115.1 hypothetical protein [Marivirga sp.]